MIYDSKFFDEETLENMEPYFLFRRRGREEMEKILLMNQEDYAEEISKLLNFDGPVDASRMRIMLREGEGDKAALGVSRWGIGGEKDINYFAWAINLEELPKEYHPSDK